MAEAEKQISPGALVTKERSKKEIYRSNESENNTSEFPDHRDLEAVYHRLNHKDKFELVKTALEKMIDDPDQKPHIQDIEEIPSDLEKMPPTDTPQIFKKNIKNSNRYIITIRLNNGEPNSVIMMEKEVNTDGTIDFDLEEEDDDERKKLTDQQKRAKQTGLFHITTDSTVSEYNKFFSKKYHSREGKWMRGKMTTEEYKDGFEKKNKMSLEDYWEKTDQKRIQGKKGDVRREKGYEAKRAVKEWDEDDFIDTFERTWESEDDVVEKWRAERDAKVEFAKEQAKKLKDFADEQFQDKFPELHDFVENFSANPVAETRRIISDLATKVRNKVRGTP